MRKEEKKRRKRKRKRGRGVKGKIERRKERRKGGRKGRKEKELMACNPLADLTLVCVEGPVTPLADLTLGGGAGLYPAGLIVTIVCVEGCNPRWCLSNSCCVVEGPITPLADLTLVCFQCNLLYGWQMFSYKTLPDSLLTIIKLQLGIFNYSEVLDYNPVLGALLVGVLCGLHGLRGPEPPDLCDPGGFSGRTDPAPGQGRV
ncbi:hypothetical protein WMY93_032697 [Mugilogobius chulae]|uniref:Uncharacterized protein n=1 Tax=Mugilogobius chulae TaxID=88201 RepID=A0AAW0MVM1_9GOBI